MSNSSIVTDIRSKATCLGVCAAEHPDVLHVAKYAVCAVEYSEALHVAKNAFWQKAAQDAGRPGIRMRNLLKVCVGNGHLSASDALQVADAHVVLQRCHVKDLHVLRRRSFGIHEASTKRPQICARFAVVVWSGHT